jgi:hypothetical protein
LSPPSHISFSARQARARKKKENCYYSSFLSRLRAGRDDGVNAIAIDIAQYDIPIYIVSVILDAHFSSIPEYRSLGYHSNINEILSADAGF